MHVMIWVCDGFKPVKACELEAGVSAVLSAIKRLHNHWTLNQSVTL
jgi:hypothetical protein